MSKKFRSSLFVAALTFGGITSAFGTDIEGLYTGDVEDEKWMVLVREIGSSAYYMTLFSLDETISFSDPTKLEENRFEIRGGRDSAIMEFIEDEIELVDQSGGEALRLTKLLGEPGDINGTYMYSEPGYESMGFLVFDEQNGTISVDLEDWYFLGGGYIDAQASDTYVIDDGFDEYILIFNEDSSCTVVDERYEYTLGEKSSLYPSQRFVPTGADSIAGLYRGQSGLGEAVLLTRPIGNRLYELNLLNLQEEMDFGSGQVRLVEGGRQLETEQIRLTFSENGLTFEDIEYGESAGFEKITDLELEEIGTYFYENPESGYTMLLSVAGVGDRFEVNADIWESEAYFDVRLNSRNIYSFESRYYQFVFAFDRGVCRVVFDDSLSTLKKIASVDDKWFGEDSISGIIPGLSKTNSFEELLESHFPKGPPPSFYQTAGLFEIDPQKTKELTVDGMRPISVSPDGNNVFVVGDESIALYDIEADRIGYQEILPTTRLEFAGLRWSPDGSKLAFAEDFFRLMIDADIHVILIDERVHKNMTDDGTARVNLARGEGVVDNLLFWLSENELVFLRSNFGTSRGSRLKKLNLLTGAVEGVSAALVETPMITSMFFNRIGGQIYFTNSRGGETLEEGVWVLDPVEEEPVLLIAQSDEIDTPVVVSDMSLDGEWLMLYFPQIHQNQNSSADMAAFSLFNVSEETLVPILDSSDLASKQINNAVFSPDGTKVLFVYGTRDSSERHVAVADIGSTEYHVLHTVTDPTAGISPLSSGATGTVGLDWSKDDTIFVSIDFGERALILKP